MGPHNMQNYDNINNSIFFRGTRNTTIAPGKAKVKCINIFLCKSHDDMTTTKLASTLCKIIWLKILFIDKVVRYKRKVNQVP